MAKDYYKILGVKKNASEEKIREHWVRLMRQLHPDQRAGEAGEDQRIKEVNEAYQVLKHSSTRTEYDLKMAYGQKRKGSYFRKLSVPVSVLIVLLIFGTLYYKNRQIISTQTTSVSQEKISQIDQANQKDERNQINQRNERNGRNQINQRNQRNEIAVSKRPRINSIEATTRQSSGPPSLGLPTQINETNEINRPIPEQSSPRPSEASQRRQSFHPEGVNSSEAQFHPKDNPLQNQIDQRKEIDPSPHSRIAVAAFLPADASAHPRIEPVEATTRQPAVTPPASPPKAVTEITQTNQATQTNERNQTNPTLVAARIDPPPVLIATEEEVREFFRKYTERYGNKDLEGFLSLFSARAVQNQQDGLDRIRKIYQKFFEQSQEVKYYLSNLKIEIYQNGAEAKARYELVQLLKRNGERNAWRGEVRWMLTKEGGALKILSLAYQSQKSN
jgi:curved DNA-binding protein CbpA